MVLDRIDGELPVCLSELDQPLREPNDILKENVRVDHAVQDHERILQAFREVNRRRPAVCNGVSLRNVEDVRRVSLVVVRPVGHAPESSSCAEMLRLGKEGEERDETAVAAAVETDALGVNLELRLEILRRVDVILQVAPTHESINRCAPVAAIASRGSIVEIEYRVAFRREELVEHVLAGVLRPEVPDVVKVAGAVDENDGGTVRLSAHVFRL